MLDPRLLDILACPVCKAAVVPDAQHASLTCSACGRVYPVRDGLPVMLVDQPKLK